MIDRLVEVFCYIDDFCKGFFCSFEESLLGERQGKRRGPQGGLVESEIMTILILYHGSNYRHFKNFYNGVIRLWLKPAFPDAPSYQRFIELVPRVMAPMAVLVHGLMGQKTGIYYLDSTPLPVCHNLRIKRHKVFEGLAARGKSSTGWFYGLKLHLIFNHLHEIVAITLTPGNVHDTQPVSQLAKGLAGKLFGDKGYISKKLTEILGKKGLFLFTRVRKSMKALLISFQDKILLNSRNMAETIIGHIKEFSSLNLPKHRSVTNAFIHISAALIAYQINPITPKSRVALT